MLIFIYEYLGKRAAEDSKFLVEKLQETVDPSKIKVLNNGFTIDVDQVRILIRYGDDWSKIKGITVDYFYTSSNGVSDYLSKRGGIELKHLFDICELVKGGN